MTRIETPESLRREHHHLFRELRELAEEKGETGSRVKELLALLEPHFEKEEESAMPLLGALKPISERDGMPDRSLVASLHARFLSEYPVMLREHLQIKRLIGRVCSSAKNARDQRALATMAELEHHAAVEEEVLYPAALLAGDAMRFVSPRAGVREAQIASGSMIS